MPAPSMLRGLTRHNVAQRTPVLYASMNEALEKNGLAWEVKKRPLFARIPTGTNPETGEQTGIMKRADNLFAITRTDTNATLGAATARYETISNAEAFAPLGEVAGEFGINIVSAREVDGGKLVAVQALPEKPLLIAGEPIMPYMLFATRHDGAGRMRGFSAPERLWCLNQLRKLILGDGVEVAVSHTASAKQRLEDARKLIRAAFVGQTTFVRTAEELLAQTFSREEFEALALQLLPKPDESNAATTSRMLTNWETRFDALMTQAYGAADLNDIRYTAWGAVNAVADFEQHLVPIRSSDAASLDEALFKRQMFNGALTEQAYALLRPASR